MRNQQQKKQQKPQKQKPQKNKSKQKKAHVGFIGKPHGVVGAFFVYGREEQIPDVEEIFVGMDESSAQSAKIVRNFVSSKKPVLQIDLIANREQLAKFSRQNIYLALEDLDFDPETEFFINDVIGKIVEYTGDNGEKIIFGEIGSVYETPSNINVCVKKENREIDLPLNPDYFDMNFSPDSKSIALLFDPKELEDFWTNSKKRGKT